MSMSIPAIPLGSKALQRLPWNACINHCASKPLAAFE